LEQIVHVPVISYNTGITPNLIRDGKNSYIVNKNGMSALVAIIKDNFYFDASIREEWSQKALAAVSGIFDYIGARNLVLEIEDDNSLYA